MTGRIEGRIAVVTGGASGIGRAVAKRFRSEGAQVVAVDRSMAGLKAAHGDDTGILLIEQDVTAADAGARIVDSAIFQFGALDILVNNAGICEYRMLDETTDEIWDRTIAIDLTSLFRISRYAAPFLIKRGPAGRIINTASIMAERPYPSLTAYTSAKHGVAGLTKSLAVELGQYGVTANYILPGATLTGITTPLLDANESLRSVYDRMSVLGRMADPAELAAAFLFLASDEASFITGHGLVVDGGALLI